MCGSKVIVSPLTEALQPELVALRRGGLTICQRDLLSRSNLLRPSACANAHAVNNVVVAVKTAADAVQGILGSKTTA